MAVASDATAALWGESWHVGSASVREVDDAHRFAALRAPWTAAAVLAPTPSVFLRHEWFAAAWAWRQRSASLSLRVADVGSRCAVLPLVRPHAAPRRLELLTVPDTQFADLVTAARDAEDAAQAFAADLATRRDWDVLYLDYLRAGSLVERFLVPALRTEGLAVRIEPRGVNRYVDLRLGWDAYLATRSRRLKKALHLAANRLRRAGEVTIEHVGADADDARLAEALDAAIAISAASWKRETGNALDQPGPQAFIRSLAQAARCQRWLSLWLLRLDGRPLAMEYQLVHGEDVHALRADFRAECTSISPGTHLFRAVLEAQCASPLARHYLGPGDNPYKLRWTELATPMMRVHVRNRTLRGQWHAMLAR